MMINQIQDLTYGEQREIRNKPIIQNWLGVQLQKLGKYDVMDWVEIPNQDDESPPWYIEQKARRMCYSSLLGNYRSPTLKYPSAIIGKNKIDFMKAHSNGIVIFDFQDCIMYWVFDESQYQKMEIETQFLRGERAGCVDKPHPVVHIPCELLTLLPQ